MKTKIALTCGSALGALMALALVSGASAQETTTAWKGAPQFTNDGVSFKVRGRILIDAVFQDVDRETGADFSTRAFRGRQIFLGVEGQLNNYFAYKAEGGAANGGAWAWDDVVIEYKPNDNTSVMFGNIKAAGLENLTSTRFTTFMDRGPYGEIGPDSYLTSAVVKVNGEDWTATAAVQGDSINNADVTTAVTGTPSVALSPDLQERMGFTARASWAPVLTDSDKVHLGAFGRYRDHGNEAAFSYATRPGTAFGGRYITSGAMGDTDTTWGVEGAWVHNAFSVQGEYASIDVTRLTTGTGATVGGDPKVQVGYVFASFWPTGEMRNYDPKKGEFSRPKILNPVTAGGMGGLEVGIRYDWADMTDVYNTAGNPAALTAARDAGEYTSWTLGVNYYPVPYVRFQANYTQAQHDNPAVGRDVDVDQFQLRAQLDF